MFLFYPKMCILYLFIYIYRKNKNTNNRYASNTKYKEDKYILKIKKNQILFDDYQTNGYIR